MNNGQKILAAMLAVAVVVLALVAFAPQAAERRCVGVAVLDTTKWERSYGRYLVFRVWDDGTVERHANPFHAGADGAGSGA